MKKISVIVPVYQAEKYINRCVDSILNQTYSNLEVLLIDDGSKDQSGKICDEYTEKDSRVKVFHQKNAGVSVARNCGLDQATGDYITFVDSDDFIEKQMYQKMMEQVDTYYCDLVMCDCVKDDGKNQIPYSHDIRAGYYDYEQLKKEYYPHLLMMENVEYPATISNWLLLFKKDLIQDIRYVEGVRFSEDLLFGAQVMLQARSFYYMKGEQYYHYWMNGDSVTHRFAADKWRDYKKLYHVIQVYFEKNSQFDFRNQIDLCLLFFVYNAVGEILKANELEKEKKSKLVQEILSTKEVKNMFHRIHILQLPISWKLKIVTYLYKYQMIGVLINKNE